MRNVRLIRILPYIALLLDACCAHSPVVTGIQPYHFVQSVSLPGAGGWDYLTVDVPARRVYIAHNTHVDVLDADSATQVGIIHNTQGVHGIAIAPDLKRGFASDGKSNSVTVFDTTTLRPIAQVRTRKKPDAIIYEPLTHRVFAFNGDNDSVTVIDAKTARRIGTIALGGTPEFSATDGNGLVWVNLEDKSMLLKIDAQRMKVVGRWPVSPGTNPSSMAIDVAHRRIFIGCRNTLLIVADADSGHIISSLPIGNHVDATVFDSQTGLVVTSNGDGTLSVIHQDNADTYRVVQTVITPKGSRTLALDSKTHRLFVPAAEFAAPPAISTVSNPKRRPQVVDGSFTVRIYAR